MKSFQETASSAGEFPSRARSPSMRTARFKAPERNISSPTSYQTVQTRSEAAWGFPDEFDRKSHNRHWTYDAKSMFTNLSGSFESLDPFGRQQHGNFALPPSMAKRMGQTELAPAIEQPSILVTGGLNLDTGISASVLAFDPSFNTVQQCSVLPTPLHHHRTVLVGSDVIVVGGMLESADGPYLCTRRCYRLNVAKMQWSRVADLKTERAHHGLVHCDGRILALGGLTIGRKLVSSMEYYDMKRNKWTKMKGSLPQPMMAMGVALFCSLVWIAGGVVGSSEDDLACTAAVHCYDPRTKTWTSTMPPLPRARAYLGLLCTSGSLVALGGSLSLDQLQHGSVADVLRLSSDQRAWEPLPSMPKACHSVDAVAFGESLYVFGGISDGHVLADVRLLRDGRWSLCAHLPASVLGPSVVALPGPQHTPQQGGDGSAAAAESAEARASRKDEDLIMWSWHNF
ncbi:beta-scruin-like [Amblyomma americanum]